MEVTEDGSGGECIADPERCAHCCHINLGGEGVHGQEHGGEAIAAHERIAECRGMAFGPAALLLMGRAATDNIRQIELLSEIMGSTVPAASGMAKSLRSAGGDLGSLESAAMHASAQLQAAKNGRDNLALAPGDTVSVERTPATAAVDIIQTFFRVSVGGTMSWF